MGDDGRSGGGTPAPAAADGACGSRGAPAATGPAARSRTRWRAAAARALDAVCGRCGWLQQAGALTAKNFTVAWRSRRSTALRLLAPAIFLLLALVVNAALTANAALQARVTAVTDPAPAPLPPIPSCGQDVYIAGRPCIDFVWSPSNDSEAQVRA